MRGTGVEGCKNVPIAPLQKPIDDIQTNVYMRPIRRKLSNRQPCLRVGRRGSTSRELFHSWSKWLCCSGSAVMHYSAVHDAKYKGRVWLGWRAGSVPENTAARTVRRDLCASVEPWTRKWTECRPSLGTWPIYYLFWVSAYYCRKCLRRAAASWSPGCCLNDERVVWGTWK